MDDTRDVTSIRWSAISSPLGSTVDIANDSAAGTTATFDVVGLYVLELRAVDATIQEGFDRIEVRVYADRCEAAKNNPTSFYVAPSYDLDDDCTEDFGDFAVLATRWSEAGSFNDFVTFAAEWLEDRSLTGNVLYDAGSVPVPPAEATSSLPQRN